jgi:FdhD protein
MLEVVVAKTVRRRVLRVRVPDQAESRADLLAVEEPLEIRVDDSPLTVTMRTPGDDIDLAAGFLFTEGLLRSPADIREIRMCDDNVAAVTLNTELVLAGVSGTGTDLNGAGTISTGATDRVSAGHRNFMMTSACGVCGKDSIEAIRVKSRFDVRPDPVRVSPALLAELPDRLREAQRVFASTGGLHAAGLFAADGTLLVLREDVGRHNAVDKVIGWALRTGRLPLAGCVLLVSGRASFELAQKALMAGIPVLAAVSAPSSLATELAEEGGMTLVGFLRGGSMNVYTGAHRIAAADATERAGLSR